MLPLRIETGRYHIIKDCKTKKYRKLNIEERTCLLCNAESVEDDNHFLCKCCRFKEPRGKMFNEICLKVKIFASLTDQEKIQLLLSMKAWNCNPNSKFKI